MGHAATHVTCKNSSVWSSISIKNSKFILPFLKGKNLLDTDVSGAYLQSKKEILKLIKEQGAKTRILSFEFNDAQKCDEILDFIDLYSKSELMFSNSIDSLQAYYNGDVLGGNGATWAKAMVQIVNPNYDFSGWTTSFNGYELIVPQNIHLKQD